MERTLIQLKSDFADMADKHKQIQSFFWGDFVDAISRDAVNYPLMVCTLVPSQIGDSYTGVDLQVIICDKYLEKDYRIIDEVHSDMLRILKDIDITLKQFRFQDYLDLETDLNTEPFINRGHDISAGWSGIFRMRIHDYENRCAIPYDGFNFDESSTGAGCPSGTVTITDDDGNVLKTVTVASNGSETSVINDSDIQINSTSRFSVNAEATQNINLLDSNGDTVTVDSISGDDVTLNTLETDFVLTVKTDNAGTSASNQFTLPISSGAQYTVETSEQTLTDQTGAVTLEWASAGTYEVRCRGIIERILFNNGGDKLKVLTVNQGYVSWGNNNLGAYHGCSNITSFVFNNSFMNNTTEGDRMLLSSGTFEIKEGLTLNSLTNGSNMFNATGAFGTCPDILLENLTNGFRMFRSTSITGMPNANLESLTDGSGMFDNVTLPTTDYSNILIRMAANNPNINVTFDGGNSQYNAAGEVARNTLISNGWTITDGGLE